MSTAVVEQTNGSVELLDTSTNQFMPMMTVERAMERMRALQSFREMMVEDKDYGIIPGSIKPCLLKPGAEKLCTFFGLTVPDPEFVESVKDWTGKDHGSPFFYFEVRQQLKRGGEVIASQVGSANSWESKHRYRWVPEHDAPTELDLSRLKKRDGSISEFEFAIQKAETGGKYGKPAEYWQQFQEAMRKGTARKFKKKAKGDREFDAIEIGCMMFRVPNPDMADLVNNLQKMAQKRAFVAATLIAVNASEFFTQDLEDLAEDHHESHEEPVKPAAPKHDSKALAASKIAMSAKLAEGFVRQFANAATEQDIFHIGDNVKVSNGSVLPTDKTALRDAMKAALARVRARPITATADGIPGYDDASMDVPDPAEVFPQEVGA